MNLYAFKHKETGNLLRFTRFNLDDENFGTLYLFTENERDVPWVSNDIENLKFILNAKGINQFESMFGKSPSDEEVDINNYEIIEFQSK